MRGKSLTQWSLGKSPQSSPLLQLQPVQVILTSYLVLCPKDSDGAKLLLLRHCQVGPVHAGGQRRPVRLRRHLPRLQEELLRRDGLRRQEEAGVHEQVGGTQCDQMARLFLNIGPFDTTEIRPKA